MINKIIKITIAQIIMWGLACLADVVQYSANDFIQYICAFIVPICLLVNYGLIWVSMHSYEKNKMIKWIAQYIMFLMIWWLETYLIVIVIDRLIEADKWITRKEGFLPGIIYWGWGLFAVIIPTVIILMHILSTVIKRFNRYQFLQKGFNILLGICVVVAVYFGMTTYAETKYYTIAILAGFACFFFNWCYFRA